jgi:hypothetical protein
MGPAPTNNVGNLRYDKSVTYVLRDFIQYLLYYIVVCCELLT